MKCTSKRQDTRKRKRNRRARKTQRTMTPRNKRHSPGKRLTAEEKKVRCKKLKEREEFKERRRQLKRENEETVQINHMQRAFTKIFSLDGLDQLARKTGFIKRGGEITAFAFLYIVSFGFLGNGAISLTCLVGGLSTHFSIFVTPQALSKRINSNPSPKFLKTVLQQLLGIQMTIGFKNPLSGCFPMFSAIYLQDSSQMELNEALSKEYKGSGGAASKSGLKMDLIYDIANLLVCGIKLTSSTVNDQNNATEILRLVKSKSLVIRDLGYFTIDCLRKIQVKGGYYLSRLSISTYVYLNEDDKEPIAIPDYLKKLHATGEGSHNVTVYVGKSERFKTRLVAEKVPTHVQAQRAARFKIERKKAASEYYLEWSGYSIFITNIPEGMFSVKMIIELYKIRWQIELVFKNLKSNIEIHILKGTKKNRIDSLVYGKIITLVVIFIIQNYTANIAKDKEVSSDKLTKLLMSDHRLRDAIIQNDLSMLLVGLEYDIILVCKQKRSKKTTCESLKEACRRENLERNQVMPSGVIIEADFFEKQLQEAV